MNALVRLTSVNGHSHCGLVFRCARVLRQIAPRHLYAPAYCRPPAIIRHYFRQLNCSKRICRVPSGGVVGVAGGVVGGAGVRTLVTEEHQRRAHQKQEAKKLAKAEKQRWHLDRIKAKEAERQATVTSYDIQTAPGQKKDVSGPLPEAYSPEYVESAWYEWWEKEGFFSPEYCSNTKASSDGVERVDAAARPFVVCLPPPNVTGSLHLGHALGNAIQDAIVRWHRMSGDVTLWNPGCDHAGIATQSVVERKVWRELGVTRHDLGREKFIEKVWMWKREKGDRIYEQMKRLGSSLDWSRACFTLDPKLSHAVNEAFIRLFDEGTIYRSTRLVNWSCALKSAISDIEVDSVSVEGRTMLEIPGYEQKIEFGVMSTFSYPIQGSDGHISVSTTRLETMLGDTGVAVHPSDPRYAPLHGKHAWHPLTQRPLPIVCSETVDPSLGTEVERGAGAVKLTPAHDRSDYEVCRQHGLQTFNILSDDGRLINVPHPFLGLKRFDAREEVRKALETLGLFRGTVSHPMVVPQCSRSKDIIEFLLKDQWYVDCKDMALKARQAVSSGRLTLTPGACEKQWDDWLTNIQDWCISRQLWWGHRIPVYRIESSADESNAGPGCEPVWVAAHGVEQAIDKASKRLGLAKHTLSATQDEDVLDTWFSSSIFPFSIFGWPDQTADLRRFYPTSLVETAADIMFFWVARMVMMGERLTGQLPFKQVLFHSILRDAQGRKMSKSLGNVIDPMDVIHGISLEGLQGGLGGSNLPLGELEIARRGQQQSFPLGIPPCGADALRFTLCSYNSTGQFINVDVGHVKATRHFCNKVWQAFRFVSTNLAFPHFQPTSSLPQRSEAQSATDRWMLSRLSLVVESCRRSLAAYNLSEVTAALHAFWVNDLCDVYLEYSKPVLRSGVGPRVRAVQDVLYWSSDAGLRLLAPLMPFLTEELYQRLPPPCQRAPSITVAPFPQPHQYGLRDECVEADMCVVRRITYQLLSTRRDLGLTRAKAHVYIDSSLAEVRRAVDDHLWALVTLSRSSAVDLLAGRDGKDDRLSSNSCSDERGPVAPPVGCLRVTGDGDWTIFMQLEGLIDSKLELERLERQKLKLGTEITNLNERLNDDCVTPAQQLIDEEKLKSATSNLRRIASIVESLRVISV